MSGPWEQYQAPAEGPWSNYSAMGPQKPPVPFKIGAEGLPNAAAEAVLYTNPLEQAAHGSKAAAQNLWLRLKDIANNVPATPANAGLMSRDIPLPPPPNNPLSQEDQQQVQVNREIMKQSPMALTGGIATDLAATAPFAGPLYSALRGGASSVLPAWAQFMAPTAGAAGSGAATSLLTQPVLNGESSAENAKGGAVGGAIMDALFRGAGRIAQPITQSPAVQNLLNKNIVPTIGQSAGGMMNKMEEKISSWPFVGDLINSARGRARDETGVAGINLQMPKGMEVNQPGTAGVEQARANLSEGYKALYGKTEIGRDATLIQDLDAAVMKPTIPLSEEYKKAYDRVVKTEILDRLKPNETYPTGQVKSEIESAISTKIRELGPMPSGQDAAFKIALEGARDAVRNLANRGAGVDQAQRAALDRGWANMKDMQTAAQRSEVNKGVPTPLQIINSATEGTKLEKLGRDAQEVLGNRVPNSGTTDRALMALLMGAAGAGASQTETYQHTPGLSSIGPAAWLALGLSPLAYSRMGSRYAVGDLIPGQPALANAMRQMSPYGAQAGALYAPYR